MEIKEFISLLEKKNFSLSVDGTKLILKTNKSKLSEAEINDVKKDPSIISYIRNNKEAIIQYLKKTKDLSDNISSIYRLSGLQAGMLFHNLYDESGGSYQNQLKCDLLNLDLDAFSKSWQHLLQLHTILRSSFYYDAFKIPVQCVYRHVEMPIEVLDLRNMTGELQAAAVAAYEKADHKKGFDFTAAPLMRIMLLRLTDNCYRMLWTSHHILMDGWSTPVLLEELLTTYQSLVAGESVFKLSAEEDCYEDYIRFLDQQDKEQEEMYWRGYLSRLETATLLPFIASNARRNEGTGNFKEEILFLQASFTQQIDAFAKRCRITVNTVMQGVWSYLLHQYTGQSNIAFGVVVSGRPEDLPGVERRVGLYINTLPLCSHLDEGRDIEGWLQELQQQQQQSRNYQYTSLMDTQKWSPVRGDLFDSILVFQNYPISKVVTSLPGPLKIENLLTLEQTSNYPMLVRIIAEDEINIQFIYKDEFINIESVKQIKCHFEKVLQQMILPESVTINHLNLLTDSEERELLHIFNNTAATFPLNQTLIDLFESQVILKGTSAAITFEDQNISYLELNERSNQLAHYLRDKGVSNETLVPLFFNRSIDMVVAILGVLKSGGAYVPVDPTLPVERIRYILKDTGARVALSNSSLIKLMTDEDIQIINVNNDRSLIGSCPTSNLLRLSSGENLAYVIYTSGSTGRPKGVMVEHRNIINYILHQSLVFNITADDRILQFTNYCFDPSVEQIFLALLNGAKLICLPDEVRLNKNLFEVFLEKNEVSHLHATPSFLNNITVRPYKGLKRVISAGESCRMTLAAEWSKICDFYNKYGPTEATVSVTQYALGTSVNKLSSQTSVPIGQPVSNTRLYVVNERGGLVPAGVTGELWIGGAQVARGYLNLQELTEDKFIPDVFIPDSSARLYKTGDLVRWLPDGNIEFMGRKDEQVKVRGYRIELGEIEAVLQNAPGVKHAAVIANEDQLGNRRLIGYVVPTNVFDAAPIQQYLKTMLPEYMLPAFLVEIAVLPMTINGKVDKKLLPAFDTDNTMANRYVAPRTEMEQKLAEIWQELLLHDCIGINDNFFELGGDSIITIQLVSRAKKLGYELQVADVFTYQTIGRITDAIKKRIVSVNNLDEQGILEGESGLLPMQHRYFKKSYTNVSYYNQAILLSLSKNISVVQVATIFKVLIAQHDSLRFYYEKSEKGEWKQYYGTEGNTIEEIDLSAADAEFSSSAVENICNYFQRSLNIEKGDLFKVVWIKSPTRETYNRIFIVAHHLVIDGISWRILLQDMETLLSAAINNLSLTLGTKASSYRQWYHALEQYACSKKVSIQQNYWKHITESYEPLTQLYPYYEIAEGESAINTYVNTLNESMTIQLLKETSTVYHTESNELLMAALAKVLCSWTGKNKFTIGMEAHGRENINSQIDISRTVGWFTSLFPFLLEYTDNMSVTDLVKTTKENFSRIPDKGIGYGVLNYMVDGRPEVLRHWDVVVNYLGRRDNVIQHSQFFASASEPVGISIDPENHSDQLLSITLTVDRELIVQWEYRKNHFSELVIKTLADDFIKTLSSIIQFCLDQKAMGVSEYSPANYGLSNDVGYKEMDLFLKTPIRSGQLRAEFLDDCYRLSGLQEGMLFHNLYDESGLSYRNQLKCDLLNVDLDAFYKTWQYLLQQHTILRSSFHHNEFKIPVQCVYRQVEMPIEVLDLRSMSEDDRNVAAAAYEETDHKKGFDFTIAPLMRVLLLRLGENRYRMFWTSHHILMDGWSVPILMEEFLLTYESLLAGRDTSLIQANEDCYKDYIRYLGQQDKEKEELYWSSYTRRLETATLLPFIATNVRRNSGAGNYKEETLVLSASFTEQLNAFVKRCHVTVNTLMQAAWSYLLHQYTGQGDIAFGVVVSGRPEDMPGVEKRVGLYINTLPLCSHFEETYDIERWLQLLQKEQQQSRTYQYSSLSNIQKWSPVQGELFDSMMVFQNYPVSEIIAARQWALQVENLNFKEQANFPFYITISVSQNIKISFSYNESLLAENYVKQIKHHFEKVLVEMVSNEKQLLQNIHYLDGSNANELINVFSGEEFSHPQNNNLVALFEEQAENTPDKVALVFEGQKLTYQDLNERSNRLAHYLCRKGIHAETLVPVCMNRSLEMIIGIMAILKSGGAFVPVDPHYPAERISYMLQDIKSNLVLSNDVYPSMVAAIENKGIDVIDVNAQSYSIAEMPITNPGKTINAQGLAYMIYTSGTTGHPKGVLIEHQSILNYLLTCREQYVKTANNQGSGSYMHLSYTFDASLTAMFIPLITGKSVVIADAGASAAEVFDLPAFKKYGPYDFIKLTPAHLPIFEEAVKDELDLYTSCLVIGGEALISSHIRRLSRNSAVNVINEYGPTEAAVACTIYKVNLSLLPVSQTAIPIGRPLPNNYIFITDRKGRLVAPGVPGQLCIAGLQVARGYLNLRELTAGCFVTNPFGKGKLYQTGDLARWLPDGNIEYIGRLDEQVKIRGYRVELGEIETVIQDVPAVKNAKVLLYKKGDDQSPELRAYVQVDDQVHPSLVDFLALYNNHKVQIADEDTVAKKDWMDPLLLINQIRSQLKKTLPVYMHPAHIFLVDQYPLTVSNKVDKKALFEIRGYGIVSSDNGNPLTETEQKLVEIWKQLLELEDVCITNNFFEIGGDSLLAVRLISMIRKQMDVEISISSFFELLTIERTARYINVNVLEEKETEYETIKL